MEYNAYIFAYNYKGSLSNIETVDINDANSDWIKVQLTCGPYDTYQYTKTNCCTVILDALKLAMPQRYNTALRKSGMINDKLLSHPETLRYFLKALG